MKLIKAYCILLIALLWSNNVFSQSNGITNNWILGYGSYAGYPNGHTWIEFIGGIPQITSDSLEMDIFRTSANISDSQGNLLFYTNGYYIADASNDTMQNGSNIGPSTYFNTSQPKGFIIPQACLILPKPGSNSIYYLFHNTFDNPPQNNTSYYLYMTTIDMSLNNGLGAVTSKNVVMIQDTLNTGKITACKHANGRDWWVLCQKANSNIYYKLLISTNVILGPYSQNIGNSRGVLPVGMTGFSPDGTKFAFFYAIHTMQGGLDVFDFNRCTGVLSNPVHVNIPQSTGLSGGMAFSGNSRYLYCANIDELYQFDMASANIAASQQTVAVWDSFYSPSPPFATLFEIPLLAPDGKIYISTGNSTFHLHVINNPDSTGMACDVQQHAVQVPRYYSNGLPNHPNFFLKCDSTLGCLCAPTTDLTPDPSPKERGVKVFPNPNNGNFTLQFDVKNVSGMLEIYDVMGNLVYKDYVSAWSQFKKVILTPREAVSGLTPLQGLGVSGGIFNCILKRGSEIESVKVIIQK
jgi:hypothetical protein